MSHALKLFRAKDSGKGCAAINPDNEEEISFTEEEVLAIVDEIMNDDTATIDTFSNEELEAFIDAMQEYGISLEDILGDEEAETMPRSGLPACSGYWGANWKHAYVMRWDMAGGWPLYTTGPNCVMWAPDTSSDSGNDCGTDYDDYMLSFYFGNHAESLSTLKNMLRWSSSSAVVELLLDAYVEGRLYEQTYGGSRDNYNFYACVDDFFGGYLETIRLQKYY